MTQTKDATAVCTSCTKPKAELKRKESKVLPGVSLYLCKECIKEKREPRGYVILAGRRAQQAGGNGLDAISFWIKPQRYCGEPITIRELT